MKRLGLVCVLLCTHILLHADEGLWLPTALKIADMQAKGMKLTAEQIYSINQACLKDAILMFGGGCTGEVVSKEGLLLTNHHCGAGAIQRLSTPEHNYTVNGYWAKNRNEELPCPGITVTFTRRMYDVTDSMLIGVKPGMKAGVRDSIIGLHAFLMERRVNKEGAATHIEAHVVPFYYGNQFILIQTVTYKDIRLVGAPPESMGNYGGDEDNWEWPRHTSDFSVFRIYADAHGNAVDYNANNVPYKPEYVLPISINGVKEGDFTMVYGFPGRTAEYLPSSAVKLTQDVIDPIRISARTAKLDVWLKHMRANDTVHLQYAAKYSGVANGWKKWQGEVLGLKKSNAIAHKIEYEMALQEKLKNTPYNHLIEDLNKKYDSLSTLQRAYEGWNECIMGIERVQVAAKFDKLIQYALTGKGDTSELRKVVKQLKASLPAFYKDFNLNVDLDVSDKLELQYVNIYISTRIKENNLNTDIPYIPLIDCAFNTREKVIQMLDNFSFSEYRKLSKDPAYKLYLLKPTTEIAQITRINTDIANLMKQYMKVQKEYMSNQRTFYPDANSTLRVAYGKVEGFSPRDAFNYRYYTTAQGVLDKHQKDTVVYSLPQRWINLYKNKDFGRYADKDGTLHTCFIASNHTTGGNSGSPVLNAEGALIGINFDRCWEGTMSDYNFDKDLCRNVIVDIRYVLWTIDKYGNAGYLVNEMNIQ